MVCSPRPGEPRTARPALGAAFATAGAALAAVGATVAAGAASPSALLALAPFLVVALGLVAWRPGPSRLRTVGWSIVAAAAATFVILARA